MVCAGIGSRAWLQGGEDPGPLARPAVPEIVDSAETRPGPAHHPAESTTTESVTIPGWGNDPAAGLEGSIVLEEQPHTGVIPNIPPANMPGRTETADKHRRRSAPPQGDQIGDGAGSEEALMVTLQSRIDVDFDHQPIADVLASLQKQLKITFWIDLPHVAAQVEQIEEQTGGASTITLHARNIRVSSVLNLVLAPCSLDWLVQDEVIRITTAEVAGATLETHVYAVSGLIEAGVTTAQLATTIMQGISPASWKGAPASQSPSIQELPQALVIRQSQRVHAEIEYLLEDLQAAHDQGPVQIRASRDAPIALKVYQVGPLGSEELAAHLQELVAPDTWESADGPGMIRSVSGGILLVRNSIPVQEEIARVLGELTGTPDQ
jgi:hypothetical protein